MIELAPTTAIMLYLFLTLAVILGIWTFGHYKKRKEKIEIRQEALYTCEYCHFTYLENRESSVNRCPQCGSYNKDNDFCM